MLINTNQYVFLNADDPGHLVEPPGDFRENPSGGRGHTKLTKKKCKNQDKIQKATQKMQSNNLGEKNTKKKNLTF